MNDTLWVKKCDSILCWSDISLYTNDFDEVIAKTAFTGGMFGDTSSTTTPEIGTSGSFAKCWTRGDDNIIQLMKKGSSDFVNAGLEPFSEYYASQILEALNLKHVNYSLFKKDNEYFTKCPLFTTESIGFKPISDFMVQPYDINDIFSLYTKLGYQDALIEMLIADAIIFNVDRHTENFGFLVNNDTFEILEPAPLFDHNLSLLCYAMNTDFKTKEGINNYLNTQGHKLISGDFIKPIKSLIIKGFKNKLKNFLDFKFTTHEFYNLPEQRILDLNNLVINQATQLLN